MLHIVPLRIVLLRGDADGSVCNINRKNETVVGNRVKADIFPQRTKALYIALFEKSPPHQILLNFKIILCVKGFNA